jgi:isopentenyl-diphosphate Delta-isomerase
MTEVTPISSRKSDHIRINLSEDVRSNLTTGLERFRFVHQALPDLDLDQVDLHLDLFAKRLKAPLLISSMTGGTEEAGAINQVLARAAQAAGLAMGLGSQRAAIEDPRLAASYQVRKAAPDILLFANLGAVQLNYEYSLEECIQAVEMVGADALILHLNPLQEALQPGGNTRFAGLLMKIEAICRQLPVPVIVKEVGWGISDDAAIELSNVGVAAIDVAGAGGTSWSQVEMYRTGDESLARVAAAFRGWGIPTAESIRMAHTVAPKLPIFASGGLRDGIDVAKCIALGASLGGMAGPFLRAAAQSEETLMKMIDEITREIRICMFATGAPDLETLRTQIRLIDERDSLD